MMMFSHEYLNHLEFISVLLYLFPYYHLNIFSYFFTEKIFIYLYRI